MSAGFFREGRAVRGVVVLLGLFGALSCSMPACAAVVFKMGDTVYVDGKEYTLEEWKKMRDNRQPGQPQAAPVSAAQPQASSVSVAQPRAGTCTTPIYYDEFPGDDDKFQCSAGLVMLTRAQILEKGWKVDFIEKIPPQPGQPAQSPRGLPLGLYKLVISR